MKVRKLKATIVAMTDTYTREWLCAYRASRSFGYGVFEAFVVAFLVDVPEELT
jgi:hypothetical protein